MHNIFLDEQKIYSNRDFINLLNLVLDSLLYKSNQSSKFVIEESGVYLTNLDDLKLYIGSQIFDKFFVDSSLKSLILGFFHPITPTLQSLINVPT